MWEVINPKAISYHKYFFEVPTVEKTVPEYDKPVLFPRCPERMPVSVIAYSKDRKKAIIATNNSYLLKVKYAKRLSADEVRKICISQ